MAIKAKNDYLIVKLLEDTRYEVLKTGVILSKGVEVGFTRDSEASKRGKRYRYVRYRGSDLKVNRVVYAKFGDEPLNPKKVIHHEDDDSLNNNATNLKQITQWANMQAKGKAAKYNIEDEEIVEEDLPF